MASTTRTRGGMPAALRSGADGNERLTALTGAVLLVLLAVEGGTIVALRPLLPVHFFVGMLLAGPVLLKMGSTGYRFIRYYTGAPDYRRKGPPALLLRLLGPFLVLTSAGVVGTGVALAFAKPQHGLLLAAHKASFVLWFMVMTVHVLAYIWRVPGLIFADLRTGPGRHSAARHSRGAPRDRDYDGLPYGGRPYSGRPYGAAGGDRGRGTRVAGRALRWLLLGIALAASLVLAAATVHLAGPWAMIGGDH